MSAVLETQGLSKWFGEAVAVNNLDLSIGPGVTGLLGPNGAGKSTFIRLALGLYQPSRGVIRIWGETPRNNLGVLRRIGCCPEADSLYEDHTGYEFVYWLTRYWGMTRRQALQAAEEACHAVGMADRMHDLIAEYSRGMRQRMKIAQALALKPDLLFLDEPMSGLDPKGREEIFALIRRMGEEGRTIIVSSHVLHEIERVTNNVVLLHNGCVLAQGPVGHIRSLIAEHPRTVTVECSAPRELAARFMDDATTLGVEFGPATFTVQTTDLDRFFDRLNGYIIDEAAEVSDIHCVDESLQAVFDYLVR